jgi:DNA repair exonuclease SbcCD nuclease subunit
MTRIIGIGDVHEHPGQRNRDRLQALDQIIDEGLTVANLGAWVVAGDLFHGRSDVEGRNNWDLRFMRMAAAAPVVVVDGNHGERQDLDGFSRLRAAWPIYVFDKPCVTDIHLATGQTASVFPFPYPFKGGLVGARVAHGDLVDTADALLDPIFMAAAARLEAARAAGHLTFMVGHANIAGALSSAGQPQIGKEIEVAEAHLVRLGPILKLFGHIHRPQEIAGAIFIGSVCRLDFGETEEKRFVVAEIAQDSSFTYESRRINVAPMFLVRGSLTRAGFTLAADSDVETLQRFALQDWDGQDVRVRYEYQESERPVLDEQGLRALFASAYRLKVESEVVPDRQVRAPQVAKAVTLDGKLAAMRADGILPASMADKVALLEQHDAAAVLRQVKSWLADVESSEPVRVAA